MSPSFNSTHSSSTGSPAKSARIVSEEARGGSNRARRPHPRARNLEAVEHQRRFRLSDDEAVVLGARTVTRAAFEQEARALHQPAYALRVQKWLVDALTSAGRFMRYVHPCYFGSFVNKSAKTIPAYTPKEISPNATRALRVSILLMR